MVEHWLSALPPLEEYNFLYHQFIGSLPKETKKICSMNGFKGGMTEFLKGETDDLLLQVFALDDLVQKTDLKFFYDIKGVYLEKIDPIVTAQHLTRVNFSSLITGYIHMHAQQIPINKIFKQKNAQELEYSIDFELPNECIGAGVALGRKFFIPYQTPSTPLIGRYRLAV